MSSPISAMMHSAARLRTPVDRVEVITALEKGTVSHDCGMRDRTGGLAVVRITLRQSEYVCSKRRLGSQRVLPTNTFGRSCRRRVLGRTRFDGHGAIPREAAISSWVARAIVGRSIETRSLRVGRRRRALPQDRLAADRQERSVSARVVGRVVARHLRADRIWLSDVPRTR